MSGPEDPGGPGQRRESAALTPDIQAAVEQVMAMFPPGRGDHGMAAQIDALAQLMDPDVRRRLVEAVEQLRAAGLEAGSGSPSGPAVLDLRGTPAGEALRESVMAFAASAGTAQPLAPAQIIIDGPAPEPEAALAQPGAEAVTPVAADEVPAPSVAESTLAPPVVRAEGRPSPQPSLVEDAGSGGFFGWLSRLLNGREA